MEIVSKITEPNLVWNIFTYVAEAPLTKEKRKIHKVQKELCGPIYKDFVKKVVKDTIYLKKIFMEENPEDVVPLSTYAFVSCFDKDEYPFRNDHRIDYQLNLIFPTEDGEYKSYKIHGDLAVCDFVL